jgi:predicted ATP-binding protein involved in virulence
MVAHLLKSQVLVDIQAGIGKHNIPIAVYYPTERTIIDVPLRIRKRHDFTHQLAVFEGALQRRSQDFKVFFEWFRDREDLENERRLDGEPGHRDRELEAVRRAVPAMLTSWGDLRVKRNPLRMEVRKVDEVLRVDQLSHGEKCVLALFADLARRLAIANPTLHDPLTGQGIVLIDEVELHLHPGWQRRIIGALTRTFPNCQFVMSTHSPQVLSEVPNDQVFLLDQDERGTVQVYGDMPVFGRDANTILETVLEVPERPVAVLARIEAIYDALAERAYPEAHEKLDTLEEELGHDEPEVTRLRTLLAGKEPS